MSMRADTETGQQTLAHMAETSANADQAHVCLHMRIKHVNPYWNKNNSNDQFPVPIGPAEGWWGVHVWSPPPQGNGHAFHVTGGDRT